MRGQTHLELNRLLDAVLDLPAAQRLQWIDNLPDQTGTLKARLRSLIALSDDSALDTLPKLALTASAPSGAERPAEAAGGTIGPYCLQRILGSGGMATVWLARRTDGLIDRDVALKIPHGTWHRPGLAERMARERQILAALNHPNIGKLYDAGLTADGTPYLALEYVEGRPIDAYCEERQLDINGRLVLFMQVAHAVAHAHGKLVVHRDLKPSNILVAADGQVRLLDFGIARLLDDPAARSAVTELSGRALTLDYASPEQISNEPITVATDVYSLGVVLYELLTGSRPYQLNRTSRRALEDAILEGEPRRPSDAAATHASRRTLRPDLDAIILKALRKNPDERYPAVNALADDIQRYLCGRPVQARPAGLSYRLRRFVGRNKLAVAACISVVVALFGGAGIALWQTRVAVVERTRAEHVRDFVISLLRETDPYTRADGVSLGAAEFLSRAAQRVESELSQQPVLAIELLGNIAESLWGLGNYDAAARTLEPALQKAPPDDSLAVGRAHRILAQTYTELGRIDEARRHLDIALASPGVRGSAIESIAVQLERSAQAMEASRFDEALAASQEALQLAQTTPGISASTLERAWRYRAVVYRAQGRAAQAIDGYRHAYELALSAYHHDDRHPTVMETRMGYARALLMENRWREAHEHMLAAVEGSTRTFGAEAALTGNFLGSLGDVQVKLGYIREGLENCRRGLALYERQTQLGTRDHATRLRMVGNALLAARDVEAAAQVLGRAVAIRSGFDDPYELPGIRAPYAQALIRSGKLDAAEEELAKVSAAGDRLRPSVRIEALLYRGMLYRQRGEYSAASSALNEALDLAKAAPNSEYDQALIRHESGLVQTGLEHPAAALSEHRQAAELIGRAQARATPALADILTGQGHALLALGRRGDAAEAFAKALAFWQTFEPAHEQNYRTALALERRARQSAQSSRPDR